MALGVGKVVEAGIVAALGALQLGDVDLVGERRPDDADLAADNPFVGSEPLHGYLRLGACESGRSCESAYLDIAVTLFICKLRKSLEHVEFRAASGEFGEYELHE